MSYLVAVKRVIRKPELAALVERDASLRVTREDAETIDLVWSSGGEECEFQLVQGELQATTPSTAAMTKLGSIAEALGASVVGEEDLIPQSLPAHSGQSGIFAGRSTWIGWPVLVIVLSVLLLWRW